MAGHAGARACGHGACLHASASRPGPAPAVPPQADRAHRRGDRAPAGRRGGGGEDHHRPGRRRPRRDAEPPRASPDPLDRPHRPTRDPRRGGLSAGTGPPDPRASRSAGSGLGRPGLHGGGKGRASHAGVASATGPSGDLGHAIRSRPHDLRGRRQPGVEESVYEDTGVLQFETVDGVDYYWTRGTHLLELLTSEGVVSVRVEGNVLLWRDGALHDAPRDGSAEGRGHADRRRPREPPDPGRCSRGIGRTKEGSA